MTEQYPPAYLEANNVLYSLYCLVQLLSTLKICKPDYSMLLLFLTSITIRYCRYIHKTIPTCLFKNKQRLIVIALLSSVVVKATNHPESANQ